MNYKKDWKMNLNFIKICIVIFIALIVGCGDSTAINERYYHSDSGTIHSTINRRNENALDDIIIDSRVDKFIIDGNKIYVARRPTIHFKKDGTVRIRLTDKCEIFVINIENNEVHEISDDQHGLKELNCSTKG
jgi:hypothetical protein